MNPCIKFYASITSLVLLSCAGANCNKDYYFGESLKDEEDAWLVAEVAYTFGPTEQTCLQLIRALEDYLNEADRYKKCAETPEEMESLNDDIEIARAQYDALMC